MQPRALSPLLLHQQTTGITIDQRTICFIPLSLSLCFVENSNTVLIQLCRVPCIPQGKLGGCTVISRGVILNYTTYYLNLGASRQGHEGFKAQEVWKQSGCKHSNQKRKPLMVKNTKAIKISRFKWAFFVLEILPSHFKVIITF